MHVIKKKILTTVLAAAAALSGAVVVSGPAHADATPRPSIACGSRSSYDYETGFGLGQFFKAGSFCLTEGPFKAVFQGDGNLVVYKNDQVLWSSNTASPRERSLAMRGNGDVVIQDGSPYCCGFAWSTGTSGTVGFYRLAMQSDGNFVLYNKSHVSLPFRALWSSGTAGR
ncbi:MULTISPECIES: hypothetical protein [unclassified Rathayibacter]|uniref:hypothetical protein n=1 Tax=unclassified Rathayibacter TaxID=2609250 RepID=UPI001FB298F2|nr:MULTISPECIES: hypothetical protein [unclassified Rathayibacter]MCJ1674427.1 hypothetical protein [Rathayibacter sp. VKM Ac-2929]MCJ1684708.1 hypothetical protein [Rathayibacter sp. VKM Ac-2928]